MKTKIYFGLLAFLIIIGCSKDDLITTEQQSVSAENNNQSVASGVLNSKGPIKDNAGVGTGLWLKGYSDLNSKELTVVFADEYPDMKILSHGNFSGKLIGYGTIDAVQSIYEIKILSQINNKTVNFTTCWGQYIYNLEINGTVYLNDRDSSFFTFTISGEFHTNHDLYTVNDVYVGVGDALTGVITYREGKFLDFEKPLNGSVWCNDLTSGIISLRIY